MKLACTRIHIQAGGRSVYAINHQRPGCLSRHIRLIKNSMRTCLPWEGEPIVIHSPRAHTHKTKDNVFASFRFHLEKFCSALLKIAEEGKQRTIPCNPCIPCAAIAATAFNANAIIKGFPF